MKNTYIAVIPARGGSKRIPNKNIRPLGGHPLMAHTIHTARSSECFADVIVATDSPEYAEVANSYGASTPFLRKAEESGDNSPDIVWMTEFCNHCISLHGDSVYMVLLRPTSPLRSPGMLRRAIAEFETHPGYDSLRAMQPVSEHPGKMWRIVGTQALPLLPFSLDGVPWHSNQTNKLDKIYVQNASLEIVAAKTVIETQSISGHSIYPFITADFEGYDLNSQEDWDYLEFLLSTGVVTLSNPEISSK